MSFETNDLSDAKTQTVDQDRAGLRSLIAKDQQEMCPSCHRPLDLTVASNCIDAGHKLTVRWAA